MDVIPGVPELVTLALGGGLVATVQAIGKAIAAHRAGARARERDVLTDSEQWRRTADDARRRAEADRDWWRQRAVDVWLTCVRHGGEPPELGAPPPEDKTPPRP